MDACEIKYPDIRGAIKLNPENWDFDKIQIMPFGYVPPNMQGYLLNNPARAGQLKPGQFVAVNYNYRVSYWSSSFNGIAIMCVFRDYVEGRFADVGAYQKLRNNLIVTSYLNHIDYSYIYPIRKLVGDTPGGYILPTDKESFDFLIATDEGREIINGFIKIIRPENEEPKKKTT